jgi:hypothetical protein
MIKHALHDWTLVEIHFDWRSGRVTVELDDLSFARRVFIAEGVRELHVPKENEWGPSVRVNGAIETDAPLGIGRCLKIEMQSGDVIQITAQQFSLSPV